MAIVQVPAVDPLLRQHCRSSSLDSVFSFGGCGESQHQLPCGVPTPSMSLMSDVEQHSPAFPSSESRAASLQQNTEQGPASSSSVFQTDTNTKNKSIDVLFSVDSAKRFEKDLLVSLRTLHERVVLRNLALMFNDGTTSLVEQVDQILKDFAGTTACDPPSFRSAATSSCNFPPGRATGNGDGARTRTSDPTDQVQDSTFFKVTTNTTAVADAFSSTLVVSVDGEQAVVKPTCRMSPPAKLQQVPLDRTSRFGFCSSSSSEEEQTQPLGQPRRELEDVTRTPEKTKSLQTSTSPNAARDSKKNMLTSSCTEGEGDAPTEGEGENNKKSDHSHNIYGRANSIAVTPMFPRLAPGERMLSPTAEEEGHCPTTPLSVKTRIEDRLSWSVQTVEVDEAAVRDALDHDGSSGCSVVDKSRVVPVQPGSPTFFCVQDVPIPETSNDGEDVIHEKKMLYLQRDSALPPEEEQGDLFLTPEVEMNAVEHEEKMQDEVDKQDNVEDNSGKFADAKNEGVTTGLRKAVHGSSPLDRKMKSSSSPLDKVVEKKRPLNGQRRSPGEKLLLVRSTGRRNTGSPLIATGGQASKSKIPSPPRPKKKAGGASPSPGGVQVVSTRPGVRTSTLLTSPNSTLLKSPAKINSAPPLQVAAGEANKRGVDVAHSSSSGGANLSKTRIGNTSTDQAVARPPQPPRVGVQKSVSPQRKGLPSTSPSGVPQRISPLRKLAVAREAKAGAPRESCVRHSPSSAGQRKAGTPAPGRGVYCLDDTTSSSCPPVVDGQKLPTAEAHHEEAAPNTTDTSAGLSSQLMPAPRMLNVSDVHDVPPEDGAQLEVAKQEASPGDDHFHDVEDQDVQSNAHHSALTQLQDGQEDGTTGTSVTTASSQQLPLMVSCFYGESMISRSSWAPADEDRSPVRRSTDATTMRRRFSTTEQQRSGRISVRRDRNYGVSPSAQFRAAQERFESESRNFSSATSGQHPGGDDDEEEDGTSDQTSGRGGTTFHDAVHPENGPSLFDTDTEHYDPHTGEHHVGRNGGSSAASSSPRSSSTKNGSTSVNGGVFRNGNVEYHQGPRASASYHLDRLLGAHHSSLYAPREITPRDEQNLTEHIRSIQEVNASENAEHYAYMGLLDGEQSSKCSSPRMSLNGASSPSGALSPKSGALSPKSGALSPKSGALSPRGRSNRSSRNTSKQSSAVTFRDHHDHHGDHANGREGHYHGLGHHHHNGRHNHPHRDMLESFQAERQYLIQIGADRYCRIGYGFGNLGRTVVTVRTESQDVLTFIDDPMTRHHATAGSGSSSHRPHREAHGLRTDLTQHRLLVDDQYPTYEHLLPDFMTGNMNKQAGVGSVSGSGPYNNFPVGSPLPTNLLAGGSIPTAPEGSPRTSRSIGMAALMQGRAAGGTRAGDQDSSALNDKFFFFREPEPGGFNGDQGASSTQQHHSHHHGPEHAHLHHAHHHGHYHHGHHTLESHTGGPREMYGAGASSIVYVNLGKGYTTRSVDANTAGQPGAAAPEEPALDGVPGNNAASRDSRSSRQFVSTTSDIEKQNTNTATSSSTTVRVSEDVAVCLGLATPWDNEHTHVKNMICVAHSGEIREAWQKSSEEFLVESDLMVEAGAQSRLLTARGEAVAFLEEREKENGVGDDDYPDEGAGTTTSRTRKLLVPRLEDREHVSLWNHQRMVEAVVVRTEHHTRHENFKHGAGKHVVDENGNLVVMPNTNGSQEKTTTTTTKTSSSSRVLVMRDCEPENPFDFARGKPGVLGKFKTNAESNKVEGVRYEGLFASGGNSASGPGGASSPPMEGAGAAAAAAFRKAGGGRPNRWLQAKSLLAGRASSPDDGAAAQTGGSRAGLKNVVATAVAEARKVFLKPKRWDSIDVTADKDKDESASAKVVSPPSPSPRRSSKSVVAFTDANEGSRPSTTSAGPGGPNKPPAYVAPKRFSTRPSSMFEDAVSTPEDEGAAQRGDGQANSKDDENLIPEDGGGQQTFHFMEYEPESSSGEEGSASTSSSSDEKGKDGAAASQQTGSPQRPTAEAAELQRGMILGRGNSQILPRLQLPNSPSRGLGGILGQTGGGGRTNIGAPLTARGIMSPGISNIPSPGNSSPAATAAASSSKNPKRSSSTITSPSGKTRKIRHHHHPHHQKKMMKKAETAFRESHSVSDNIINLVESARNSTAGSRSVSPDEARGVPRGDLQVDEGAKNEDKTPDDNIEEDEEDEDSRGEYATSSSDTPTDEKTKRFSRSATASVQSNAMKNQKNYKNKSGTLYPGRDHTVASKKNSFPIVGVKSMMMRASQQGVRPEDCAPLIELPQWQMLKLAEKPQLKDALVGHSLHDTLREFSNRGRASVAGMSKTSNDVKDDLHGEDGTTRQDGVDQATTKASKQATGSNTSPGSCPSGSPATRRLKSSGSTFLSPPRRSTASKLKIKSPDTIFFPEKFLQSIDVFLEQNAVADPEEVRDGLLWEHFIESMEDELIRTTGSPTRSPRRSAAAAIVHRSNQEHKSISRSWSWRGSTSTGDEQTPSAAAGRKGGEADNVGARSGNISATAHRNLQQTPASSTSNGRSSTNTSLMEQKPHFQHRMRGSEMGTTYIIIDASVSFGPNSTSTFLKTPTAFVYPRNGSTQAVQLVPRTTGATTCGVGSTHFYQHHSTSGQKLSSSQLQLFESSTSQLGLGGSSKGSLSSQLNPAQDHQQLRLHIVPVPKVLNWSSVRLFAEKLLIENMLRDCEDRKLRKKARKKSEMQERKKMLRVTPQSAPSGGSQTNASTSGALGTTAQHHSGSVSHPDAAQKQLPVYVATSGNPRDHLRLNAGRMLRESLRKGAAEQDLAFRAGLKMLSKDGKPINSVPGGIIVEAVPGRSGGSKKTTSSPGADSAATTAGLLYEAELLSYGLAAKSIGFVPKGSEFVSNPHREHLLPDSDDHVGSSSSNNQYCRAEPAAWSPGSPGGRSRTPGGGQKGGRSLSMPPGLHVDVEALQQVSLPHRGVLVGKNSAHALVGRFPPSSQGRGRRAVSSASAAAANKRAVSGGIYSSSSTLHGPAENRFDDTNLRTPHGLALQLPQTAPLMTLHSTMIRAHLSRSPPKTMNQLATIPGVGDLGRKSRSQSKPGSPHEYSTAAAANSTTSTGPSGGLPSGGLISAPPTAPGGFLRPPSAFTGLGDHGTKGGPLYAGGALSSSSSHPRGAASVLPHHIKQLTNLRSPRMLGEVSLAPSLSVGQLATVASSAAPAPSSGVPEVQVGPLGVAPGGTATETSGIGYPLPPRGPNSPHGAAGSSRVSSKNSGGQTQVQLPPQLPASTPSKVATDKHHQHFADQFDWIFEKQKQAGLDVSRRLREHDGFVRQQAAELLHEQALSSREAKLVAEQQAKALAQKQRKREAEQQQAAKLQEARQAVMEVGNCVNQEVESAPLTITSNSRAGVDHGGEDRRPLISNGRAAGDGGEDRRPLSRSIGVEGNSGSSTSAAYTPPKFVAQSNAEKQRYGFIQFTNRRTKQILFDPAEGGVMASLAASAPIPAPPTSHHAYITTASKESLSTGQVARKANKNPLVAKASDLRAFLSTPPPALPSTGPGTEPSVIHDSANKINKILSGEQVPSGLTAEKVGKFHMPGLVDVKKTIEKVQQDRSNEKQDVRTRARRRSSIERHEAAAVAATERIRASRRESKIKLEDEAAAEEKGGAPFSSYSYGAGGTSTSGGNRASSRTPRPRNVELERDPVQQQRGLISPARPSKGPRPGDWRKKPEIKVASASSPPKTLLGVDTPRLKLVPQLGQIAGSPGLVSDGGGTSVDGAGTSFLFAPESRGTSKPAPLRYFSVMDTKKSYEAGGGCNSPTRSRSASPKNRNYLTLLSRTPLDSHSGAGNDSVLGSSPRSTASTFIRPLGKKKSGRPEWVNPMSTRKSVSSWAQIPVNVLDSPDGLADANLRLPIPGPSTSRGSSPTRSSRMPNRSSPGARSCSSRRGGGSTTPRSARSRSQHNLHQPCGQDDAVEQHDGQCTFGASSPSRSSSSQQKARPKAKPFHYDSSSGAYTAEYYDATHQQHVLERCYPNGIPEEQRRLEAELSTVEADMANLRKKLVRREQETLKRLEEINRVGPSPAEKRKAKFYARMASPKKRGVPVGMVAKTALKSKDNNTWKLVGPTSGGFSFYSSESLTTAPEDSARLGFGTSSLQSSPVISSKRTMRNGDCSSAKKPKKSPKKDRVEDNPTSSTRDFSRCTTSEELEHTGRDQELNLGDARAEDEDRDTNLYEDVVERTSSAEQHEVQESDQGSDSAFLSASSSSSAFSFSPGKIGNTSQRVLASRVAAKRSSTGNILRMNVVLPGHQQQALLLGGLKNTSKTSSTRRARSVSQGAPLSPVWEEGRSNSLDNNKRASPKKRLSGKAATMMFYPEHQMMLGSSTLSSSAGVVLEGAAGVGGGTTSISSCSAAGVGGGTTSISSCSAGDSKTVEVRENDDVQHRSTSQINRHLIFEPLGTCEDVIVIKEEEVELEDADGEEVAPQLRSVADHAGPVPLPPQQDQVGTLSSSSSASTPTASQNSSSDRTRARTAAPAKVFSEQRLVSSDSANMINMTGQRQVRPASATRSTSSKVSTEVLPCSATQVKIVRQPTTSTSATSLTKEPNRSALQELVQPRGPSSRIVTAQQQPQQNRGRRLNKPPAQPQSQQSVRLHNPPTTTTTTANRGMLHQIFASRRQRKTDVAPTIAVRTTRGSSLRRDIGQERRLSASVDGDLLLRSQPSTGQS
ncbi:unnamed protein product [Amoebophrya sp. A25]|nr:unnamed protein product [Amoebophrya sp. A25]|eukprot:GSA25T00002684001.1